MKMLVNINEKLSDDEVHQLEIEIDSGSLDAMVCYAGDAVRYYSDDLSELNCRKKKLFNANTEGGHAPALQAIAILAAMTNDHNNWEVVMESFGDRAPPKLGYYAYQQIKKQRFGQDRLADWYHILELSAEKGFLLARRDIAEKRFKRFGVVGRVLFYIYKFWLTLVAVKFALKDSNDPRLPVTK